MKKEEIKILNSVIRIVFGTMIFMLFWFHTLGYISISNVKTIVLIMFILSVYLLITGTAKICPICLLIERIRK
jgi:hypothetical protein